MVPAIVRPQVFKISPNITYLSDEWTDSDKQDMINRS